MKIKNTISSSIITAAVGMLSPFIPDLTPTKLIAALKSYDANQSIPSDNGRPKKPYSIAEVMELLGVSKPTIYRLFEDGTLTKKKVRGLTRIPAADVERLLVGGEF